MSQQSNGGKSWLEQQIAKLDALYQLHGRDGLKEQPLTDVCLLLSSKELAFRDAPKRDIGEREKEANRRLELEIKDLSGLVNAQLAMANAQRSRPPLQPGAPQQAQKFEPKQRDRGREPER
jgi:hypothetical protein